MAFLEAHGVGKDYPGVTALDDVDLSVALQRVHVLVGENGAGKSTLVKILTGTEAPDRGRIRMDGADPLADRAKFGLVAYVPQEFNLFTNLSVAENLFLPHGGHGRSSFRVGMRDLIRRAEPYLERFGIAAGPRDLVGRISVSDQQLLQIARATTNPDMQVVILDEPTSALTTRETDQVFKVVRDIRETCGVIFISHKMDEVFEIGDDYTVLRSGEKVEAGRLADTDAGGLIRAMSGKELAMDRLHRPDPSGIDPDSRIMSVRGLSGDGFENVSFDLCRGEVLGFAGLVGAGRSEVMQTIFGFRKARAGEVKVEGVPWPLGRTHASVERGMLYLSEERKQHGILPLMSVRDNIGVAILDRTSTWRGIDMAEERHRVEDVVETYGIKTADLSTRIRLLSGGNQQKAIIGRAMATDPKILIFDEPTKGIDVRTKADIYEIMRELAERGVGIILVSSEMEELRKCASRIVGMHEGRVIGSFDTATTSQDELVGVIFGQKEKSDVA